MLNYLGLPAAASSHAGDIDRIIALVHWLMLVLVWHRIHALFDRKWTSRHAAPIASVRPRPRRAPCPA